MDDYLLFSFNPAILIPLNILNIAFIRKVIHYYRGDCTREQAIWVGLVSVLLPTFYALLLIGFLTYAQTLVAISPIFIPFVFGVILMHKKPGPVFVSPW
jgi:hypothetical protein